MPASTEHETLYHHAENAINAVHGDDSVSQHETVRSLRALAEHATMLADTVEGELEDDEVSPDDEEE